MCWFCVAPEEGGAKPPQSRASAYGPVPRQAGWLSPDRYADWPAGPPAQDAEAGADAAAPAPTLEAHPARVCLEN